MNAIARTANPSRLPAITAHTACRDIHTSVRIGGRRLPVTGRLTGEGAGGTVFALGGISADRRVSADEAGKGWWPLATGAGGALDPTRRAILSMDFLGETVDPFPTVQDQAEAAIAIADAAGIERFSVAGASYGGAVGLAIASRAPERVTKLAAISTAARPDPMASALRGIQRDIVRLALQHGDGRDGLDLARRLAMTTYRTRAEFRERFDGLPGNNALPSDVNAYLAARGREYAARTPPQRFLALSRSLDAVQLDLGLIRARASLLGVGEDTLIPVEDTRATALALGADYVEISSVYGHDAFLKEAELINGFLEASL
ncbi:MAG: alpha/beta fold hydrolase [Pseudomonadota bacterium]